MIAYDGYIIYEYGWGFYGKDRYIRGRSGSVSETAW